MKQWICLTDKERCDFQVTECCLCNSNEPVPEVMIVIGVEYPMYGAHKTCLETYLGEEIELVC